MEKATFGAGCFWGVEKIFRETEGVISTQVGYMGGKTAHPSYEQVCSHMTGHAEVVEITFDPEVIPFRNLLQVFWECHDPTQLNRQGPDVGSQYRSVIFCHSPGQEDAARESMAEEQKSGRYSRQIVTEILPATIFWRAEEYHQQYLEKRSGGQCRW